MPFATIKGRTGMYASLRTYRIGSGSVDAVMRRVDRDFAEALSQEPGFVAYHAIDTGNDMVMTISLFHDREQAEASNELAAQWVAEELSDFNLTRVGVIGGEAMVSRASAEILEPDQPWSGSFRLIWGWECQGRRGSRVAGRAVEEGDVW